MSRIGKSPVSIPTGVSIEIKDKLVTVKGSKGELSQELTGGVEVSMERNILTLTRLSESKQDRSLHGLYRSLINNMVIGVSSGFTKELELVGVGYRASNQGQKLELSLGFSHSILLELPLEIGVETKSDKGQNPKIILNSIDKQLLGMVSAKIRSFRKPEPYKGKGIRFVGELVRKKAGKSA
jgi:large subunit ribosomal protein L6